ncbi:BMP family ABC transporter substrate-binding protein [Nitriliruptoraceae bacterium ZYF776]|nr:BMP family ABC transporter substrate-binding protein [Profundirhabdus halotolerans]
MRKFTRATAVVAAAALALTACGEAPEDEPTTTTDDGGETDDGDDGDADGQAAEDVDFKACMITDAGGVDDASFNETSYNGLLRAEEELGIEVQVLESTSETDFEPNMQTFIQQGDCDLIVPVGFLLEEVTFQAAEANPDQNFAIVDVANGEGVDNVLGLTFNTSEAAFLAGYAAAATSESGVLGTYGGVNIPTVTIFMDGFLAGANHYADESGEDIQVLGWDGSDGQFTGNFDNLDDGRRITESLMDNGADTILPVAGPVGGGSAAAIEDRGEGRLIWVDTDGYESTSYGSMIFTSVVKQMDVAVYDAVAASIDGTFEGGEYVGTLENEGVDIAPFHDFEGDVPPEVVDALEELRQAIIAGELDVDPAA